jgi:histidinol-phosphate aminotransferase
MMSLRPRPEILEISAYVGGESDIAGANRVVKLSANEGAFGVPPAAREALVQAAAEAHRYPDGGCSELRHAIGRRFHLDAERIVCGAGSDDLIYHLCHAYGGPGTEIMMTMHAFSMYQIAARYAGSRVVKVAERNLTADVDGMLAAVSPATRVVFLANPNNPTGTLLPAAEVARLRAGLPAEALLILDAAYAEYVERADYEAGAALVEATDNTVMTRTFSKIFGLGGARIGWCYAPAAVTDVLNRVRQPFNVSAAGQAAAIAALGVPGWVEQGRAHNTRYRAWLGHALTEMGIKVWPSEGNFFLADFGSKAGADAANAFLKSRGIIVRAMGGYGLPDCLRITIGTAEECAVVADTLAAFMAGQIVHA